MDSGLTLGAGMIGFMVTAGSQDFEREAETRKELALVVEQEMNLRCL
jgi:hypothetical protein